MSNYGLKIAEVGYDVKTCTENHLIYSSKYPQLKIQDSGSGSHTFTNNQGYFTLVTYDLGYKPFFAVWIDEGSGYKLVTYGQQVGDFYIGYIATAKTTTLELIAITTYNGGMFGDNTLPENKTVDYAWVIFYDPIKDE